MKYLLALFLALCLPQAWGTSCTAVSGTLILNATQPRSACVSPCLLFFDATTTTDTATLPGANNTYQDVYYTWSYGDTSSVSGGTSVWPYGTMLGQPFKNAGTGPVGAHLYVLPTASTTDVNYVAQVWAYDGTNVATCQMGVTIYSPSGTNGFPGSSTTCVSGTATPVAGSGGCPTGATVLNSSSISTATGSSYFASGKRVLFHCGETFTGGVNVGSSSVQVVKASIGAYGGCENTTTSRPIWSSGSVSIAENATSGSTYLPQTDIRFADIDFESTGYTAAAFTYGGASSSVNPAHLGESQITMYNLNTTQYSQSFYQDQGTQGGLIQSTCNGKNLANYCGFWNFAGITCNNGAPGLWCGQCASTATSCPATVFVNYTYNAIMGNLLNGYPNYNSASGDGETIRIPDCRMCVFSNNTIENSSPAFGATLKFAGSNWGTSDFQGGYTENVVENDNIFTGTGGTFEVSNAPFNAQNADRLRNIIFERNIIAGGPCPCSSSAGTGATKFVVAAYNVSIRNNIFYVPANDAYISDYNIQISRDGIEGTDPPTETIPRNVEVYNNTCYALTSQSGCVGFIGGDGTAAPGTLSYAYNNLWYNNGSSSTNTVGNQASSGNSCPTPGANQNCISNNTSNGNLNPGMSNGSGSFSLYSDFKPSANATGATCSGVPNYFDGFQFAWLGGCQLGAFSPVAP